MKTKVAIKYLLSKIKLHIFFVFLGKNLLTFFDAYDIINLMTGYVILKDIS